MSSKMLMQWEDGDGEGFVPWMLIERVWLPLVGWRNIRALGRYKGCQRLMYPVPDARLRRGCKQATDRAFCNIP